MNFMADPVRDYLDAQKAYESARQEAYGLFEFMRKVVEALRLNPALSMYMQYGLPLPPKQSVAALPEIDMSRWPTADALRTVLTAWRQAFAKLHATWEAIPPSDR